MNHHPNNYYNTKHMPVTPGQIKAIEELFPDLQSTPFGPIDFNTLSQYNAGEIIGAERKRQGHMRYTSFRSFSKYKPLHTIHHLATPEQWKKIGIMFTEKGLTTVNSRYKAVRDAGIETKFTSMSVLDASKLIDHLQNKVDNSL